MNTLTVVVLAFLAIVVSVESAYCPLRADQHCSDRIGGIGASASKNAAEPFWQTFSCGARGAKQTPGTPCYEAADPELEAIVPGLPRAPTKILAEAMTMHTAQASEDSGMHPAGWTGGNRWERWERLRADQSMPTVMNWGEVGHIKVYETGNGWPFVINHGFLRFERDILPDLYVDVGPIQNVEHLSNSAHWTVCKSPDCSSTREPKAFTSDKVQETYFNWNPCNTGSSVHMWVGGSRRLAFVGVGSRASWTGGRVMYAVCTDAACNDVHVTAVGSNLRNLPGVEHQCLGGKFGVGARVVIAGDGNPSIMWRSVNNPSDVVYVHCDDWKCEKTSHYQVFTLESEKINPELFNDYSLADKYGLQNSQTQAHVQEHAGFLPNPIPSAPQNARWGNLPESTGTATNARWFWEPALWWDLVSSEKGIWLVSLHQAYRSHKNVNSFMQVTACSDTECDNTGAMFPAPHVPQTGNQADYSVNPDLARYPWANLWRAGALSQEPNGAAFDGTIGSQSQDFWARGQGWRWSINKYIKGRAYSRGEDDFFNNPAFQRSRSTEAYAWTRWDLDAPMPEADEFAGWLRAMNVRERTFVPVAGDVAWASQAYSAGLSGDGLPMWVGQIEYGPIDRMSWVVCSCNDAECEEPVCHILADPQTIMDPALRQCVQSQDMFENMWGRSPERYQTASREVSIALEGDLTESNAAFPSPYGENYIEVNLQQNKNQAWVPKRPNVGHFSARHQILNGASDGLPVIVQHLSSFCMQLDGDGSADILGIANLLSNDQLNPLGYYWDTPNSLTNILASVSNRKVLLHSAKATYINCLDATCSEASVSALQPNFVSSVSAETAWNQVDSVMIAPEHILTLYAPDTTHNELSSSSFGGRLNPFNGVMSAFDPIAYNLLLMDDGDEFWRNEYGVRTEWYDAFSAAYPAWLLMRDYLGVEPHPRTAGWKSYVTNRWSSPNGKPCSLALAGDMAAADDVVFLCSAVSNAVEESIQLAGPIDGYTKRWEWQEFGWGLRWRWFGDVHFGTDTRTPNFEGFGANLAMRQYTRPHLPQATRCSLFFESPFGGDLVDEDAWQKACGFNSLSPSYSCSDDDTDQIYSGLPVQYQSFNPLLGTYDPFDSDSSASFFTSAAFGFDASAPDGFTFPEFVGGEEFTTRLTVSINFDGFPSPSNDLWFLVCSNNNAGVHLAAVDADGDQIDFISQCYRTGFLDVRAGETDEWQFCSDGVEFGVSGYEGGSDFDIDIQPDTCDYGCGLRLNDPNINRVVIGINEENYNPFHYYRIRVYENSFCGPTTTLCETAYDCD